MSDQAEIARLNKIIQALMNRAEQISNVRGSDFNLFQRAIVLEDQVRSRTGELEEALQENERITRALRESESHFRQLFERHSAIMLLIEPESGKIMDANPAAAHFYGAPLEDLRGMNMDHLNIQSEAESYQQRQQALSGEINNFVFGHRLANGAVRTVEALISPMNLQGKPLLFSIIHDITERRELEEQIRNLAFYDALTKLPNRRLLDDRLTQAMATSKRSRCYGALLFLDLDNFKPLNDVHGHTVGDLLLVEVADRLKRCVRETDTVARFGGDEFVVLVGELNTDKKASVAQAGGVAEKIRAALAQPYLLRLKQEANAEITVEHHCTSSIGVALFLANEASKEDVLKWADMAMYQAKDKGRNLIHFFEP